MAVWQLFARIRVHGCVFNRAGTACTARQMRNGLLLGNMLLWIIIIVAAATALA
jgi:hypothetical protein